MIKRDIEDIMWEERMEEKPFEAEETYNNNT